MRRGLLLVVGVMMGLVSVGAAPAGPVRGFVQEFDSVVALLDTNPTQLTTTYTCKGLNAINDGLGGQFYYFNGDTTATNATDCFAWGSGRLRRFYEGITAGRISVSGGSTNYIGSLWMGGPLSVTNAWVDVRTTGADPTATVDSRNAFQAAFNAAGPDGSVYVPDGDYKVVVTLPIKGNVKRLFGTGRIWWSLPGDYANPNTYGVNDSYTTTGVLDRNGALVAWDSSDAAGNPNAGYYGTYPWNGKGAMFQDIGNTTNNTIVSGLTFNGGWGTVNPPGTVVPITGVRSTLNENTWYAVFANCSIALMENCRFENVTGTAISHGFGDMTITGCDFGEYGDHCYYNTDQGTARIINNTFKVNRAAVSTDGNADYVAQTYRDAIKFRNMTNCIVQGNVFRDDNATRQSQFVTVESNSSNADWGTNGTKNITITGNNVKSYVGVIGASFRSTAVSDGAGLRCKNILISGNDWDVTANVMQLLDFACDGFVFSDNTVVMNSTILAQVFGSQVYSDAIKNLLITDNYCVSTNLTQPPVLLSGCLESVYITANTFVEQNVEHGTGLSLVNTISNASVERNRRVPQMKNIVIRDNKLVNYYSLLADSGHADWDSTVSYPYSSSTFDDGTYVVNNVVRDATDGLAYTNKAAVLSATRPGLDAANWGLYVSPECNIQMMSNDRCSDSTVVGSLGASLLANTGANLLKYKYKLIHNSNRNRTTLGNVVDYLFNPGSDATAVENVYTNLYSSVNNLFVQNNARFGGLQTARAKVHVQTGGLRSDGANAAGIYSPLTLAIRPDVNTDVTSNRELRFQIMTDSGSFNQHMIYNGYLSNTLAAPHYYQGVFGRMIDVEFSNPGVFKIYVSTNATYNSGSVTKEELLDLFTLAPADIASETMAYMLVKGLMKGTNLFLYGDAEITGSLIVTTPQTPASAAAAGTTGTIAWDADYVYVCVAPNTWKRTPIATW